MYMSYIHFSNLRFESNSDTLIVTVLQLNRCTYFNKIWHRDILIHEKDYKLLFIVITNIHENRAVVKK